MEIQIPEVEHLPPEQRKALLEQAVRQVNSTHSKMSNTAHYVGVVATFSVVLLVAIPKHSILIAIVAGVAAYAICFAIGFLLWQRSMIREVRKLVRQAMSN